VVFALRQQAAPDGAGAAGSAAGFGHVHGIAIDHGTGTPHVATHVGLFRVDDERTAVRVSREALDLMGFVADGPGRFLASGHPERAAAPGNLGLIESTDGGVTWRAASLAGVADFHGLYAGHGAVYGYNSTDGGFLVSTDRRTWQRRSTVTPGAFSVSPADPDVIVGVGPDGARRSTDGGRSWRPTDGPGFAALAWERPAELWGAEPTGQLWTSADAGLTWQRRGRLPGEPHALATHAGELYAAVTGDRVVSTADGGATWTTRYSPG
jgi:photosystem II stability/assembly factor-like uncharacterized protein